MKNDIVIYLCEKCGYIAKYPRISDKIPNIECHCEHPIVNIMTMIWPRKADTILARTDLYYSTRIDGKVEYMKRTLL